MNCRRLRPLLIIVYCLLRWLPSIGQTIANGYSIAHYNSDNALPQNSITGMAFDKNGFLWLSTQMGIVRFDGRNFREYNKQNCPAIHWNEFSLAQQPPGSNKIYFIPTADSSRVLTVSDDYQIIADSVSGPLHTQLLPDYKLLAADLPVKDIRCMIYKEDQQMLYIGSMTSGLYIVKLHEFQRLFFNAPGFAANSQSAQIELPGKRILTCTGVLSYNNKSHIPFPVSANFDKHVLFQTTDSAIYYSASNSLKKTDGRLRSFTDVKQLGYYLTAIIETENKELIYSNKHQVFRRTASADTLLVDGLGLPKDEEIAALKMISANMLWIGTTAGLFSYDLLKHELRKMPGLENAAVSVIYTAKDNSVWIGTYGQGLYKYYRQQFIKMPLDNRNNLATAHCFMEDRRGYFWIPTNKGLFRVFKKELDDYAAGVQPQVYYYYVDKSYGFSTNEFNACTPCGIKTSDGWFSLPSIDGLVRFNPDSVHIILPKQPVIVEQVTADNNQIRVTDKLEATRDAGSLIFQISTPYFGNKLNLHLEYTIEELNDKWYPVNDDGKLIITNLNSGRYTLTVRSQNPHAHYIYNIVQLTILPYWYEQWWFKCLLGGLAIGSFLLFFRLRYNYQVKRAQLLQQKVDERTEELSESNRVKELMISAILHDLRSPLRFLHMLARRMYNDHKTTADKGLSQLLFQFENATNEIYDFTQDFFVFTNMQKEGFAIKREKVVLRDIVSEIISFYDMGAQIQKNTFGNLVPQHLTLYTDASLLSLVLRNLVDNANKYTSEGTITIEGVRDAYSTRIIITDGGNSMNKELVARILDKTYNPSQHGMGWGYKIIIEILGKLQGSLNITSGNDKGNTITITFENNDSQ